MSRFNGIAVTGASGHKHDYPWATHLKVDQEGNLRIYAGFLKQRVFHPAGEWKALEALSNESTTKKSDQSVAHPNPDTGGEK